MRLLMGVIKDRHGTFCVRKKVPKKLEAEVARITGASKPRVAWVQRSLGTKDARRANLLAKPVLMEFDRLLASAEAALKPVPMKATLTDQEIRRLAAYHYAAILAEDEEHRRGDWEDTAEYGLSERRFRKHTEANEVALLGSEAALARGDISAIRDNLDLLFEVHGFILAPDSEAYRKLGQVVLSEHVRALRACASRSEGTPVETPNLPTAAPVSSADSARLQDAFKGWAKARNPSPSTLREYTHAIDRFIELHGDMPVVDIKRSHVRTFREALQDIPPRRTGPLKKANLPALVEWRKANPDAPRLHEGTVNKLLGGVQAVTVWARDNGVIPDDVVWADPFAGMRLDEGVPEREPWKTADLVALFASPVFTEGKRPKAGGGEAAFWLPLMGLFSGARQTELASLLLSDVAVDEASQMPFFSIVEVEEDGKRLKTEGSRRIVPIHPELIRLGFLDHVKKEREKRGTSAPIFPDLKPGTYGSVAESWSKWFGRYTNSIGIKGKSSVFHSFRHNFKDALRAGRVSEDINDALTGHSGGGVGRKYGAKDMLRRFGAEALRDAVGKAQYPGLNTTGIKVILR